MNKKIYIAILIILILVAVLLFNKKNKTAMELGKLKITRPPKIRIVYSKKLKNNERPKITSSGSAEVVLREVWSSQIEVREEFIVLLLDRRNRVLGYQLLSKGGISGTVVDIKLVYSVALKSLASGIILAHNHPAGSTEPSNQDLALTKKIQEAGKHLDIALLDHIILTKEDYYSFADNGQLNL
jgi:DNA repair protein RadC